jgi:hypothetical protein
MILALFMNLRSCPKVLQWTNTYSASLSAMKKKRLLPVAAAENLGKFENSVAVETTERVAVALAHCRQSPALNVAQRFYHQPK